jgi:hypothetical protein
MSNKRWQQICEIEAKSGVRQESLFQDRQQLLGQKIGARIVDREERVSNVRGRASRRACYLLTVPSVPILYPLAIIQYCRAPQPVRPNNQVNGTTFLPRICKFEVTLS